MHILWGGDTEHILNLIAASAREGNTIFLVPEPLSHETERLLQTLGDGIGMSAEVLTFQRLAHRVLTREGGLAAPQLDAGGRLLLLSRAVGTVRHRLTEWGRVAGNADFLSELLATIDELKCHQCIPEYLTGSGKLSDLRMIWEAFDALTAHTALDPRDLLSRVGDMLNSCGFANNVRLYIDGFISFTAQEYGIIKAFVKRGDVTILINAQPDGDDEYFMQPKRTAARLKRIAADCGAVCNETIIKNEKNIGVVDSALRAVEGKVAVAKCHDMLAECKWAAELVRSWIDSGVSCGNIAVASPAWDEYKSVFISLCARLGIPLFTDGVSPVTGKAAARFICGSMDAVLRGFEPDAVVSLLKTGLTPLSDDDCCMLEDYIRAHNMRGVYWTQDKPWEAHPSGWGAKTFSERDRKRLERLNTARVCLRAPLLKLRRAFSQSGGKAIELARALYIYCDEMRLAEQLSQRRNELAELGKERQADECRQLWGVITRAFDSFADIMGDETMSAEEFARLFALCLSCYEIGVIPLSLDKVHACALDRLNRRELKRLIIIGAGEQYMPKRITSPGLLTDEERIILEGMGVNLAPVEDERASRELYSIRSALLLPSDVLALSYPSANKAEASMFIEMLGVEPEVIERPRMKGGGAWHSNRAPLSDGGVLFSEKGTLSASRVETYNSCRWQYFSRYALKARTRGSWTPTPMDAGSMIHHVLEQMVREVMRRGGFHTNAREDALEIAGNAAAQWLNALPDAERRSARITALIGRLKQAALQVAANVFDELAASNFEPLAMEYPFASKGKAPLTGIIDRVDGWMNDGRLFIRVVDYKSGRTRFSLSDIWHGLGIQMLCYLFALNSWAGREATPAGVLYLPAHDRFTQAKRGVSDSEITAELYKTLKRDGVILDDPEVIEAMESGGEKVFLPVSYKKDGTPDSKSKIISAARLGLLKHHISGLMESLCANMERGLVDADPVTKDKPHCEFCDYRQSCFLDENDTPRVIGGMKGDEFWERLGDV